MSQLLKSHIRDHEAESENELGIRVAQLTEGLPGVHEALGLIPQHL